MAAPIKPEDLLTPAEYEKVRRERLADVIALKERRRVEVGPWVSCAFENRRTVLHQVQEMIRIERITEPSAVAHEIETFADLMPGPGELSLTLFIEITDDAQRRQALARLGGIEKTLTLTVGEHAVPAFDKRPIDPRWERPGQATAVYYLGFRLNAAAQAAFASDAGEAWVKLTHPEYSHAAALSRPQRRELASDWA
jgi:hypothetical protein